jgi:hypothetical protein
MKVNLDARRFAHLAVLMALSHFIAQYLLKNYEWKFLAAYGFSCSISCQLNNVALLILEAVNGNGGSGGSGSGDDNVKSKIQKEGNRKKKKQ